MIVLGRFQCVFLLVVLDILKANNFCYILILAF
uniref:Uncharacterized protein n=1 Tax=Arundo donax TaxID=35708 RepID=A0A0A9ASX5_ARUDO